MTTNFKDKKIIITGATGGIGKYVAKLLAKEGAKLILVAFDEKNLLTLCKEIKDLGGTSDFIVADFSHEKGLMDATAIISELNEVDILINLAGVLNFTSLGLNDFKDINRTIHINLLTPMMLAKAVLPEMVKQNKGQIINIGSIFGSIAFPYYASYSASKAALRGFSESLRRELRDTNIKITYIAPRTVRTRMNNDLASEFAKQTKAHIDDPENVARKILEVTRKGKPYAYFGFAESIFVRLNYLFPRLVDFGLRKHSSIAKEILMQDLNNNK